ncbi:uncharacterized protein LOC114308793 [Camellia sinensis]|uniref:uncharacterized protein LOC114308793 n=1 Tax=Camellia sinensis TaxID=4442 RepID=UPI001035DB03|nr:uncharacterized protein LOC114308793 [Camellia sinensis]
MPSRATDGAVGYDLSSITKMLIQPQDRCLVPTGIALQIPYGMYGRIAPRSGLALEHGIHVGAGVIDPDYRGEVKVLLYNFDKKLFQIQPGQRIAQIIFEKVALPRMVQQDGLLGTTRDTSGFGHSGMASEPMDSDSDSNSTLNIIAMMEEGETEYPQVKKLEQLIMKHSKQNPQYVLSSSAVSNYTPPQDTMMGPPGYPPATGQGPINIPQRPTYDGHSRVNFRNFRRDDKSEWWNLPSAMHSTGAMFILPHQLGKFDEVFMRWESITKAHVSMQGFTDARDKIQYIENMLGETEKLIWTQWRMKYDGEFNNLVTMGDGNEGTQNILSQMRTVFTLEDPYQGSTLMQDEAETHTIAVGWDCDFDLSQSFTKIQFDNTPPHSDDEEDTPLNFDPSYQPSTDVETDYPQRPNTNTSRLSYLDLANTEKPSTKELAHNISVIYDRVCLSSKVTLKEFRSQQLQIQSLEGSVQHLIKKIEKLEQGVNSLAQNDKRKYLQKSKHCKCYLCGEEGHYARDCTKDKKNVKDSMNGW